MGDTIVNLFFGCAVGPVSEPIHSVTWNICWNMVIWLSSVSPVLAMSGPVPTPPQSSSKGSPEHPFQEKYFKATSKDTNMGYTIANLFLGLHPAPSFTAC